MARSFESPSFFFQRKSNKTRSVRATLSRRSVTLQRYELGGNVRGTLFPKGISEKGRDDSSSGFFASSRRKAEGLAGAKSRPFRHRNGGKAAEMESQGIFQISPSPPCQGTGFPGPSAFSQYHAAAPTRPRSARTLRVPFLRCGAWVRGDVSGTPFP